jgi:quercetin dioxygenase-like cupin family protein
MKRSWWVTLLAVAASIAVAGSVWATHAPGGVVITDSARGTLDGKVKVNVDDVKIQTKDDVDVVTAEVTFAPGGSAGWHIHPGPVFVVIRTGQLSVWTEDCQMETYGPGETFFEFGPEMSMLVKNESASVPATVYGTFIVPVGAAPLTIPTEHLCGLTG